MIAAGIPVLCTLVIVAQAGWSASGGRESFAFRDVSRNGPPADASPVTWIGAGPSVLVLYERASTKRAHLFNADIAAAGSFAYAGPIDRIAAPSDDRALRLDSRYEYRRFILRDRLVRGVDGIVGVQGLARMLTLTRHASGTQRYRSAGTGLAGVIGARLHRWARWSAEIDWTNGLSVLREHDTHSVDALAETHLWGGSWLTDLSVSATARLSRHASLTGSWLTTGEGNAVSHHSYAFSRRRVVVGVTYDR
jgi:hypothetical protein